MNRYHFNRLRADKATLNHLDKNVDVYATIPAIVLSVLILRGKIAAVDNALRIQMTSLKGNRPNRRRYKTKLSLSTLSLCAALFAHGKQTGNDTLIGKSRLSESGLKKMGELDLVGICTAILKAAREIEGELVAHGIPIGSLDVYEFEIGTYRSLIDTGRSDVVSRKTARISLPLLLAEVSEHFEMRLDKQVKVLREGNPALIMEYFSSRRILNFGVHHEKVDDVPALTSAPAEDSGGA